MNLKKQSYRACAWLLAVWVMGIPSTGLGADSVKEYFDWYCAQCHGEDGSGDGVNSSVPELPVGPMNLTNPEEMERFDGDKIINTLTHGGPINTLDALMPPWGNRFTSDEIESLMKYVRSLCSDPACPK